MAVSLLYGFCCVPCYRGDWARQNKWANHRESMRSPGHYTCFRGGSENYSDSDHSPRKHGTRHCVTADSVI